MARWPYRATEMCCSICGTYNSGSLCAIEIRSLQFVRPAALRLNAWNIMVVYQFWSPSNLDFLHSYKYAFLTSILNMN